MIDGCTTDTSQHKYVQKFSKSDDTNPTLSNASLFVNGMTVMENQGKLMNNE